MKNWILWHVCSSFLTTGPCALCVVHPHRACGAPHHEDDDGDQPGADAPHGGRAAMGYAACEQRRTQTGL